MIYFLQMPMGSISIGHAKPEEVGTTIKKVRDRFAPLTVSKIATMPGNAHRFIKICKDFNSIKVGDDFNQFKPSLELVVFINDNHDESPFFRPLVFDVTYDDVQASVPGDSTLEVYIHPDMIDALIRESSRESMSPQEIVRKLLSCYLAARTAKRAGRGTGEALKEFDSFVGK